MCRQTTSWRLLLLVALLAAALDALPVSAQTNVTLFEGAR